MGNDNDDDDVVDDPCIQSPATVTVGGAIDDADVDEGDGSVAGDEDGTTDGKGRTLSTADTADGCEFVRIFVVDDGIVFVMALGPQSISR